MTNRVAMWAATSWPGTEFLEIREGSEAIDADGLVVAFVDGQAVGLEYRLRCAADWTTRRLELVRHGGSTSAALVFASDGEGHWTDGGGAELPELAGCVDVDIAVTPFTNTLPIRRLSWRTGQARDLRMVYLAVPEMTWHPASQRYTCLETGPDGSRFRYESGDFARDLAIDPNGLVVDYPGYWRRVAT